MIKRVCVFIALVVFFHLRVISQEIPLPANIGSEYIFAKDTSGSPALITKKGLYTYMGQWNFKAIRIDSLNNTVSTLNNIKKFNNQTFFSMTNGQTIYISLIGGGHVFTIKDSLLTKIDNSVIQRNQYNAAFYFHENKIHMYGGYGFWSFKNYITYLDNQTGQWEMIVPKSEYVPDGRWKSVTQKINNKLYVFGGRNNSKKNTNKDAGLNDHFVFDLKTDQFISLGKINPLVPLDFPTNPSVKIENNQAYLDENRLIVFDFLNDSLKVYNKKDLFKGIDTKKPVILKNDTIYFLKNLNKKTVLSVFLFENLKRVKPELFQISKKPENNLKIVFSGFLIIIVCWIAYKLFVFKDFLKGLVLYDESKIYYENKSEILNSKQLNVIKALEKKGQISSDNLNLIISEKKFVKSHFTSLRTKLISEINNIYQSVTESNSALIEEAPDPNDKRYKVYKIVKQVSQKESFLNFLLRI